jgi:hypothetical protein
MNVEPRRESETGPLAECVRAALNPKWVEQEIADQRTEIRASGNELVAFVFSASEDDQTCPLCSHLDGMRIDINDPDVLFLLPPLHDGCRCLPLYQTRDTKNPLEEKTFVRPSRELLDKYLAPARGPRADQTDAGRQTHNA